MTSESPITVHPITGGIGAGKSTVSALLAELGAVVVDADLIGRQVVEDNTDVLAALVKAFGRRILTDKGTLDRRRLGRLAFATEASRARLNGIVHPPLLRELKIRPKKPAVRP